jgi:hypothetical protein
LGAGESGRGGTFEKRGFGVSSVADKFAGQSHLIFGVGSTGGVTTSQLSKICYADALYKLLENVDAIALDKFALGGLRVTRVTYRAGASPARTC